MHQSIQVNLAVAGTKYNLKTLFVAAIDAVKASAAILNSPTEYNGFQFTVQSDGANAGKVKLGGRNMNGANYAGCTVFEMEMLAGDSKNYGPALSNSLYLGDYQAVADTNDQKLNLGFDSK